MIWEYIKYALDNVRHRKLRSGLMILSILIGIAAIYSLISFGQGLGSYVNDLASQSGKDKLIIQAKGTGAPGTNAAFRLTDEDIDFLSKVNGMQEITGVYLQTVEVSHRDQKVFVFAMGLPSGDRRRLIDEFTSLKLDEGRDLKSGDRLKVVLGQNHKLKDKLYDRPIQLGDKIFVSTNLVEVVGFFKTLGNPQDDNNIYLSEDAIEEFFPEIKDEFGFAIARADVNEKPSVLAEKATEKLRKFKNQEEGQENFYIQTFEQAIEQFNTILVVINIVLILIALVSLVVAAVNIMNSTYTAVLERTKEIGVMKAVGAQNKDILMVFVFEASFLGLLGGAFGVILGYGIASLGGKIVVAAGYGILKPVFPWQLAAGCLLFSFLIGSLAGLLPAHQASKLKPVDALRYE